MNQRPATTTLSLQPGEKIGSYVVVNVIATGGTGTVYKAHDPLLDRHVAIKHVVFGDAVDADRLREQVRHEAAIHKKVATAKPKRLVQFIDTIEDPRGLMLVTEFVDGVTLEQRLAANPAPHDERAALGIVAASAKSLMHLHKSGVVHRDIKPGNIMLPHKGGLKLADFGLAAIVGDQESLSIGTVRYMAPELLRGDPATPASDLYSLGLVAYELLLGRERFEQAFKTVLRDRRNPGMRWMKWHTNDRLSAPPLSEMLPGTSSTLSELIARMMDKDPARRIRSAGEVVDAIRRHFVENQDRPSDPESDTAAALVADAKAEEADEEVPAAETKEAEAPGSAFSTPGDTAKLPTKSKLPAILVSVILFWVVLFGVLFVWQSRQESKQEARRFAEARTQFQHARQKLLDGHYAEAVAGFQTLQNDWADLPTIAQTAAAWEGFARGRSAEDEGDFTAALAAYQAFDADPNGNRELVRPLIEGVQRKSGFAAALAEIEGLIDDGEFQEGRRRIGQWRAEQLTEAETKRLDEVDASLAAAEANARVEVLLRQAQRLADDNDLDGAITVLEQRNVLPPSGTAMLARLRAQRDLEAALSEAQDASSTGQLEEAIAAYRRALELKDDTLVTAELNRLEAQQAVRRGLEFYDAGRLEDAAAQFDIALLKDPDNETARQRRRELVSVTEVQSHLRAGDTALENGDLQTAIDQYTKAYSLDELDLVLQKLNEAKRRQATQRAAAAMESGLMTVAREQLDLARTLAPEHEELAALEEDFAQRVEYTAHIEAADAHRAAGEFRKAIRRFNDAKAIFATEEVEQRLDETQYTFSVAKAREHIAGELFNAARGELQLAAEIAYTDEVRDLLREVYRELGIDVDPDDVTPVSP